MAAPAAPKVGLLLKAWHTIPDIVGGSVMALIGVGFSLAGMWIYYNKDGDHKKYKLHYTVIRPDDPRVAHIRKHSNLDD